MNCKVPWCVALCEVEANACVIHRDHPKFQPLPEGAAEGLYTFEVDEGDCDVCYGSGQHTCDDDRCNVEHECGACEGEGEVTVVTVTNRESWETTEYTLEEFGVKFPGVSLEEIKKAPIEQVARRYDIDMDLYKELR